MFAKLGEFVEGQKFQNAIMILIVLNAVALGLETNPKIMGQFGKELHLFDLFRLLSLICNSHKHNAKIRNYYILLVLGLFFHRCLILNRQETYDY